MAVHEHCAGKDKGQELTVFPAFDSAEQQERSLPVRLLRTLQAAEAVTATTWPLQPAGNEDLSIWLSLQRIHSRH